MQPTVTYLPEHITSVNDMDKDNNVIQNSNAILQTSQTQSYEQFHNMESYNANHKVTDIHNENCSNISKEIKIDLDTIVPTLQSEKSESNIGVNNVTTAIATYNNAIQNAEELWTEDGKANVIGYTSEEAKNFEQNNIVCPSTSTCDENNINEIVMTLDSNQTATFDIEAVINSAVTSIDTFCENPQQSIYNKSLTENEMGTSGTEEALLAPVAPHHNQQFSFEITASSAENGTGKPMTITINPIEIETQHNTETKSTALTHGKK